MQISSQENWGPCDPGLAILSSGTDESLLMLSLKQRYHDKVIHIAKILNIKILYLKSDKRNQNSLNSFLEYVFDSKSAKS